MEVLAAGLDDFKTINDLAWEIWPDTYREILTPEQLEYMLDMMYSREAYTDQITRQGHYFLMVKNDGRYIGFASYELNYRKATAKLHKLYLLPDKQGLGAGKLLLGTIEELAAQHGNYRITLNVNRFNPAVQFYLKSGYSNLGQEDIGIGNGYFMRDFIMEKDI